MNELRSFAGLQARVYEFLEQQDETTLQEIVSGAAQLAVLRADDARAPGSSVPREGVHITSNPASAGITMAPSRATLQVAQDLARLASEPERRIYLNAADLPVKELKKVAKLLGLVRYSNLNRPELFNLLSGRGPDRTEPPAGEPRAPAPIFPHSLDDGPEADQQATIRAARRSTAAPATEGTTPNADVAAIAAHLRETETEEEGAAYLRAQRLDRASLLAVAAELQLTRVDRLRQTDLEKRVLKQAIGARRKFDGLRRW